MFLGPCLRSVQQAGFLQHRYRSGVIAPSAWTLCTWGHSWTPKMESSGRWFTVGEDELWDAAHRWWGRRFSTLRAHLKRRLYFIISMQTTVRVNLLNILPVFIIFLLNILFNACGVCLSCVFLCYRKGVISAPATTDKRTADIFKWNTLASLVFSGLDRDLTGGTSLLRRLIDLQQLINSEVARLW